MKLLARKPVFIFLVSITATFLMAIGLLLVLSLAGGPVETIRKTDTGTDYAMIRKTKISAVSFDRAGVNLNSAFSLKCEMPIGSREIMSSLTVNGERNYDLQKVSGSEYFINLKSPLAADSVYKFEMQGLRPNEKYSWAFQTKKPLKLVRTLPADKATDVPVNSGIEMTMSYDNLEDFEYHFKIEPKVPGHFEVHKKTVVFVPENDLDYAKIYKVTIEKGIKLNGSTIVTEDDNTFQFQTVMTPAGEDYSYISVNGNDFYNATAKPIFLIDGSENVLHGQIGVTVYKIPELDDFIKDKQAEYNNEQAWANPVDSEEKDISKYTEMYSYKTELSETDDFYSGKGVLELPEKLKEGYYLVKVSALNNTEWAYFQVNDIVSYISVSKNKFLFWVNNASTHNVVEGAVIDSNELRDKIKTDASGIATYDMQTVYSGEVDMMFRISVPGHEVLFAEVPVYGDSKEYIQQQNKSNSYMKYLYLDRSTYFPNDKINFFGIITPRGDGKSVDKAKLTLSYSEDLYCEEEDVTELDSTTVGVSNTGVFQGTLNVKDVEEGFLHVNLFVDDVNIQSTDVPVGKYEKPAYKISVEPDKKRMFAWDTVNFDVTASFYEGSPANGLKLKYKLEGSRSDDILVKEGEVTCNTNGKTTVSASCSNIISSSWDSVYTWLNVSNVGVEESDINAGAYVEVYPSDMMIHIDTEPTEQVCRVKVEANSIDLDKPDTGSESDCKGDPVDKDFQAVIKECHTIKIDDGVNYDNINKKSVPKYRYEDVESVIEQLNFKTVRGKYQFDFPFSEDEETNKRYQIIIKGVDSRGTDVEEKSTFYPYSYSDKEADKYGLNSIKEYYLSRTQQRDDLSVNPGEKVGYSIMSDYEKRVLPNKDAKCLFLLQRDGIVQYSVTDDTEYSFEYKKEYIPNVFVKAVYFDGKMLNPMDADEVRYNTKQSGLNIEARTDKEQYVPGDTVNVEFKVSDTNGNPISADMNVNVVEESLLENYEYYYDGSTDGDILEGLFGFSDPSGEYTDFSSHIYPELWYRRGGHPGDHMNDTTDQKETAFFQTFSTDEQGIGKISFIAPKTLTTWQLTYQGYNSSLIAGSGKIKFSTRVPFFADVLCSNKYISGDKADLIVRSFGTAVNLGDEVKYQIHLKNNSGEIKSSTMAGISGNLTYFPLDSLSPGNYILDLTAQYKDLNYSVHKEFTVVDNLLEITRVKYNKLAEGMTFNNSTSRTQLLFHNGSGYTFYEELNSLSSSWGERIDQKLSSITAHELLEKYFHEESDEQVDENELLQYQQEDGGISLLKYGDTDPELTAKVLATASSSFDKTKITDYFYSVIENNDSMPEEVASAYWGLASAGESVLIDVQNLIASDSFNGKSKLYLALALAEMGDFNTANGYLSNLIRTKGKSMSNMMYIEEGNDRDDYMENTALCAILSIKTRSPEREPLHNYLKSNRSEELLFNLEKLIYLKVLVPDVNLTGKFKYSIGDKEKEIKLEKSDTFSLNLTSDELKRLKIINVEGDVTVVERYKGPVSDLIEKKTDQFIIDRSYEVMDNTSVTFHQMDCVKVVLTPYFSEGAADGLYEVTDVLPAGFRYVAASDEYGENQSCPLKINGQTVTFNLYYSNSVSNNCDEIVYYARAILPGKFTADHCIMRQYDSMEAAFTNRNTVEILDDSQP